MHGKPWALALILLVAAGCDSSDKTAAASTTTGSTTGDSSTGSTTGVIPAPAPAAATSGLTKLKIDDLKVGKGSPAAKGDTIWVLYSGHLKDAAGKEFDSTAARGDTPFAVVVGGGQVIEGWDKGLVGMKVGGERNLYIPYLLAYGENGRGADIPPKADLFFNIKALALVKKGDENAVDLVVKKPGHGRKAKPGDRVTVTYVGTLPTGKEFDRSKASGVTFVVGRPDAGGVTALPGIDVAMSSMSEGEEAMITVPPKLGKPFGTASIPANSVLIFDLTLKKIG
jgi:FKBP-type peptidyl-prolyl cis-trans isomerase